MAGLGAVTPKGLFASYSAARVSPGCRRWARRSNFVTLVPDSLWPLRRVGICLGGVTADVFEGRTGEGPVGRIGSALVRSTKEEGTRLKQPSNFTNNGLGSQGHEGKLLYCVTWSRRGPGATGSPEGVPRSAPPQYMVGSASSLPRCGCRSPMRAPSGVGPFKGDKDPSLRAGLQIRY